MKGIDLSVLSLGWIPIACETSLDPSSHTCPLQLMYGNVFGSHAALLCYMLRPCYFNHDSAHRL